MPSLMETAGLVSLLHHHQSTTTHRRPKPTTYATTRTVLRLLKLIPTLTSGCKMTTLLRRQTKSLLSSSSSSSSTSTITLFGPRKGKLTLSIQDHPDSPHPAFLIDLPIFMHSLLREMASGLVKIALESEPATAFKSEQVKVYCNGRKAGYSVRREKATEGERGVMAMLRGVSMGAGVLPPTSGGGVVVGGEREGEGELSFMRARFERVVGSEDSVAYYMINPDGRGGGGSGGAPELSIFLVRVK